MSAKNRFPIDIDNRESKKSVVQRFMTSESEIMPDPPKTPDPVESKQPEDYNVPKQKKNEEEISESKIEETSSEKSRKPLKPEKTQDDTLTPEQKERINPFVSAKPRESASKKETKENFQEKESENTEQRLPSVGENFTLGRGRTLPQAQTQASSTPKAAQTKNIVVDAFEETAESKDEIPEVIYDYESESLDGIHQNEKSEEVAESELDKEKDGEQIQEQEIESIGESEKTYETADTDMTIDIPDMTVTTEPDEELDLSGIMVEAQSKIDELIEKTSQDNTNTVAEVSEETERILGRAVMKKIIRRAYDHDDQNIAHYVEILEKNDIKSRFYFKNTLEDAVVQEVEATLKHIKDMCKCNRCFAEICAITLNALKPHYVTTAMGELYDRVSFSDVEKLMEISSEVFKAVDHVKNSPNHK